MKARFLRQEDGFTLPEMLVTMLLMIVVLFALYNIFDASIRVFSFGNNKVEAVENARAGLGKMEREIRAAYRYNSAAGNNVRFPSRTDTKITFGNDLNGNSVVECGIPCEVITYQVYSPGGGKYVLGRANDSAGTLQPVVEFLDYQSATDTGLKLSYFQRDGVTPATGESDTAVVRIEIKIRVPNNPRDGKQILTTDVFVRNS